MHTRSPRSINLTHFNAQSSHHSVRGSGDTGLPTSKNRPLGIFNPVQAAWQAGHETDNRVEKRGVWCDHEYGCFCHRGLATFDTDIVEAKKEELNSSENLYNELGYGSVESKENVIM